MTTHEPKKILIVDDEQDLLEILSFNLEGRRYHVDTCTSAIEALTMPIEEYDLLILDVMMQGMTGFQMAEELRRKREIDVPIIFLTAKDSENDLLTGFSLGADDYISKPFSVKELLARVQAVLNRTQSGGSEEEEDEIHLANLSINIPTKTATVDGESIRLSKKEYEILQLLAEKPNHVFSRASIISRVWKGEYQGGDRTVDVHITRLRKKLKDAHVEIINRSGFGYCINEASNE